MFYINKNIIKNKNTLVIYDTKRGLTRTELLDIINSAKENENINAVFFMGSNPANNSEISFVIKKLLKEKIYVGIRVYNDNFSIPTVDLIDIFCDEDRNKWMNILTVGYGHQIRLTVPYKYISTDEDIQYLCKYIDNNILYPDEVSIEYTENLDNETQEKIKNDIKDTLRELYTYRYDKVKVNFLNEDTEDY